MISYWVNADHRVGMDQYLATRGRPIAGWIEVRTYEELAPVLEIAAGAHIFSALDQLNGAGRAAAAALFDCLKAVGAAHPLLNDPRRVLLRYDLLATLSAAGVNRFTARRANESADGLRFPIFVREESDHTGSLTGLLATRRALSRALLALRARGFRAADLLVVEFCDLAGHDGRYRKAAAFKVGNAIVPAHLLTGHPWMLKWDDAVRDVPALRANLAYVAGNPHEEWLRRVFAAAQVDYGRCDYGVGEGLLQAWEINLNPTIGYRPGAAPAPLAPDLEALLNQYRAVYHGALQTAFRALDPEQRRDRFTVRLDPSLIARMKAASARARRRKGARRLLQAVYEQPALGWPFRKAYSRFLPRA